MQVRAYAERLLAADTLAGKLAPPPEDLRDDEPGPPVRLGAPVRPAHLPIASPRRVKVPPVHGMADLSQRRRILHAFANHELQAAELFAWALLAWPDAPPAFRRGLVAILAEEQRHCRLYVDRLEALGMRFGDLPITGHFWNKIDDIDSPLAFVCAMGLTFENANLDFAQEYAAAAREAGDEATARVIDQVHEDEIGHVRFAWVWLDKLGDGADPWETYNANVHWPLGPGRARGRTFDRDARRRAGFDEEFTRRLEEAVPVRPNGRRR